MIGDVEGLCVALGIELKGWASGRERAFSCLNEGGHERGDMHPSAHVNAETGAWRCKTCGAKGGAYDLALLSGRQPRDAMDLLRSYGLADDDGGFAPRSDAESFTAGSTAPSPVVATATIEVPPMTDEIAARLLAKKGWSRSTLDHFGVGWGWRPGWGETKRVVLPLRDENGLTVGALGYLPGVEAGRKMRAPSKRDLPSGRQLFPLPVEIEGDECWILEGEGDPISAYEIGLPAVGVPGSEGWQTSWARCFSRFARVRVMGDCDDAGRRMARRVASDIAATGHPDVRVVDLDSNRDDKHDLGDEVARCASDADRAALREMLLSVAGHARLWTSRDAEIESMAQVVEEHGLPLAAPDAADLLAATEVDVPAVWGRHPDVLWAEGEPFLVVAPVGVGKTTIAGQLVLRRLGILEGPLLGHDVARTDGSVMYWSLDRDRQARRSLKRMVDVVPRGRLKWAMGLGSFKPGKASPDVIVNWLYTNRADTLVVDSLYGLLPSAVKDDSLEWYANLMRALSAASIEVLVLHHFRKAGKDDAGVGALDRILGGRQISASAGSVLALDGEPGDEVVVARHAKQPASVCGPWTLTFDRAKGTVEGEKHATPEEFLLREGRSSLRAIAEGCELPTSRAGLSRLRRQLGRLVANGTLREDDDEFWLADVGPAAEEAIF